LENSFSLPAAEQQLNGFSTLAFHTHRDQGWPGPSLAAAKLIPKEFRKVKIAPLEFSTAQFCLKGTPIAKSPIAEGVWFFRLINDEEPKGK